MHIKFNEIDELVRHNLMGGEKSVAVRIYNDGLCRIQTIRLEPGASIGYHKHETNSEVIYILKGVGTFNTDGVTEKVYPGEANYCPKGHSHSFTNETDEDIDAIAVIPEQ